MSIRILADSVNDHSRLTTILFEQFPYCLLQEINTHRMFSKMQVCDSFNHFSRNSASTRAMKAMIELAEETPFVPRWEQEQKGMSGIEDFDDKTIEDLCVEWNRDAETIIAIAKKYRDRGVHKGKYNRLLAPFLMIPVIVTGTDDIWNNFFNLRCASSADSDFREIAQDAFAAYQNSEPKICDRGYMHMPGNNDDYRWNGLTLLLKEHVVMIARVSFNRHNAGMNWDYVEDFFERLRMNRHWSPFEHIAISADGTRYRNLHGWMSLRQILELRLCD